MDMRDLVARVYFPLTEVLSYAVLGFITGMGWALFGSLAAVAVLALGVLAVRPVDKLRWRLATAWGLDAAGPTAVQVVFSQTIGVVILIMTAGFWGFRVAPLEVLGIAVASLGLSTGFALWAQARAGRKTR